jgi:hypothetical protein
MQHKILDPFCLKRFVKNISAFDKYVPIYALMVRNFMGIKAISRGGQNICGAHYRKQRGAILTSVWD